MLNWDFLYKCCLQVLSKRCCYLFPLSAFALPFFTFFLSIHFSLYSHHSSYFNFFNYLFLPSFLLSFFLSVCLFLSFFLSFFLSIHLSLSFFLSFFLSVYLFLSIRLSLSFYPFVFFFLSIRLSLSFNIGRFYPSFLFLSYFVYFYLLFTFFLSTYLPILFYITTSETRWLDYFSIFGHLQQLKLAQWFYKFSKVCSAFRQIRNRLSKICQIFVLFCQSGKISQNLVTLLAMSHFLSLILIFLSFSFISHRNCLLNALLITLSHKTHRQFNSISRLLIATFHFILF